MPPMTNDQQAALTALMEFVMSDAPMMIVEGFAGTGKSTLIHEFLKELPQYEQAIQLIMPEYTQKQVAISAPTHKALDVLRAYLGTFPTATFNTTQSLFGMQLQRDARGQSNMVHIPRNVKFGKNSLIIIDEGSYIDSPLLSIISRTLEERNSKAIILGDPAQLTPINTVEAPVFKADIPRVRLTTVIRQAPDSALANLVAVHREAVVTNKSPSFNPDNKEVLFITDKEEAQQLLRKEFCNDSWHPGDSRILAWTNHRVVAYNEWIEKQRSGQAEFTEGQYYICNSGVALHNRFLAASTEVMINSVVERGASNLGIPGDWLEIIWPQGAAMVFAPTDYAAWQRTIKQWRKNDNVGHIQTALNWIDLRNLYASTVNKAQGSTYKRAFIDLRDIGGCRSKNQRNRLMYVAVSRAQEQVILFNF